MSLDVRVVQDGQELLSTWALNEAAVEKASRQRDPRRGRRGRRPAAVALRLRRRRGGDTHRLDRLRLQRRRAGRLAGRRGTALVPISAHALFARPFVASPAAVVAVEVQPRGSAGILSCDGRRTIELPPGARIEATRGQRAVRLARLHPAPFTDRLVAKFDLPVAGWRGRTPRPAAGT